ncbi:MAG: Uma2 family endonuclease [Kofleriaceae bacterium]|nr:Uma2 family endonuclease [Kofleriaceae bacterium]
MTPARKRATYEDLLALPAHVIGEIVGGELHVSPRPALPHARAAGRIASGLDGPFDRGRGGPGGWVILIEPEIHLGEAIVVPDVAGWRRERMPAMPSAPYATVAPNWLCEVLSPSTVRFDRVDKLGVYARCGVEHVWLVDPIAQVLEVLALDRDAWRIVATYAGDAVVRAVPFDVIELELAAFWAT